MSGIALKIILTTIATPFIIVALISHIAFIEKLYEIFLNRWLYLNRWKRVDTWACIILTAYFLIILGLSFFYSFWFLLGLIPSGIICYFILAISLM